MVAAPPDAPVAQVAPDSDPDTKETLDAQWVEKAAIEEPPEGTYISPEQIQARFDLLRDLGKEKMDDLNKRVVSKLDWRMMPCVTMMFLMRLVAPFFNISISWWWNKLTRTRTAT